MIPLRLMTCALLLSAVALPAPGGGAGAVPDRPADLAGLWMAKRRFGPDVQGPLIIQRAGADYLADIAGLRLPARIEQGELRFDLPGDRGRFYGRFEGRGVIRGLWVRPPTAANTSRYASPVTLHADRPGRWTGTVRILQDELTFYLLARPQADGTMSAVLRNPDRDIGTQLGADRLVRDSNGVTLMGHRGSQPESALAAGSYNPENDTFTLDFPNRGGAFVFSREGDDSDFYPRGLHPSSYRYNPPPARDDGWPTGTLDEVGIDRAAIARVVQTLSDMPMDSTDAPQIHALLIARHGRLVLEEYFHGASRDQLHDLRSAAKSITSVTLGAAMRAGAPLSLASPVYQVMNGGQFPAGLDPQQRTMTLENLMTMSSGYFCDDSNDAAPGNEETMTNQSEEPDWYRFTMRVPLATSPGQNSVYCSASPNLALGMLGAAMHETPLWSFDRLVARPMRIDHYAWILDPLGRPYGGGSVRVLPRDFLKFGQLMLNGGTWAGRRILDPAFVAAATSPQYHLRNVYYGYLWWIEDFPYKNRTVRSFSARGAGGQVVTVVPELDLVVATMAGNYSSRVQLTYTGLIAPRSILPAVRERGDDPHAPVVDRAYDTPYGRSTDGSRVVASAAGPARR